ncbi:hypothetical protein EYF80_025609 [Liparis tanakae]|uniref:Uncharacterized protein n=1 Tax=Liparis tanakae TaxID=230148 RepID=A0A4Z2HER5_9TELE|nr:hypothetical protein EYF80_025609 [Liparis tanakae]
MSHVNKPHGGDLLKADSLGPGPRPQGCAGTGQVRGAEASRESRGQLGTKRRGHPGPHSTGVSPWLRKLEGPHL